MARGIPIIVALLGVMLLAGGCGDREEPAVPAEKTAKQPDDRQRTGLDEEVATSADIEQRADRAAEETEQAREKLTSISSQARELAREAEVVGEEVHRVTQQVEELNSRLDNVAGQAREVIARAQQALDQVLQAQQHLKERTGSLLEQVDRIEEPTESGLQDSENPQE